MNTYSLLLSYKGRIQRSNFWIAAILLMISFVALLILFDSTLGRASSIVLYPPLFWAFGAIITKRLHDRGKSLVWLLIVLIPIIGPIVLFIELGILKGTPGENRYGADPVETRREYLIVK